MIAFYYIHMISGVVAVSLFMLVGIGFGPYLSLHFRDKRSRMGMFIASVSLFVWVRILWWGLLRPIAGELGFMSEVSYKTSTLIVNSGLNFIAVFAAVAALAALHISLPPEARKRHNWLTAPFYPDRLSIFWRM